jgi:hypothetical protein
MPAGCHTLALPSTEARPPRPRRRQSTATSPANGPRNATAGRRTTPTQTDPVRRNQPAAGDATAPTDEPDPVCPRPLSSACSAVGVACQGPAPDDLVATTRSLDKPRRPWKRSREGGGDAKPKRPEQQDKPKRPGQPDEPQRTGQPASRRPLDFASALSRDPAGGVANRKLPRCRTFLNSAPTSPTFLSLAPMRSPTWAAGPAASAPAAYADLADR